MATVIEYADVELWLAAYLRAGLAAWSASVDRRWPAPDAATTGFAVVVRDDSGPDSQFHADRRVGVTVLGPADGSQYDTGRCAERVAVLLRASPEVSSTPVVRATVRGPWALDSGTRRPAYYLTSDLRVIGTPITI